MVIQLPLRQKDGFPDVLIIKKDPTCQVHQREQVILFRACNIPRPDHYIILRLYKTIRQLGQWHKLELQKEHGSQAA